MAKKRFYSQFTSLEFDRRLGDVDKKAGLFYYDPTNNRYLVFTNEDARDEYLEDPTKIDLIIGTFDAPFNYSAKIVLESKSYNAVALGSTGHYLDFTFDIENKNGQSTGENVICTYTFRKGSIRQTVTEQYAAGRNVHFNIDKYLSEGTNTITIAIQGVTTLAATTVSVTYQMVNLNISTRYNISTVYNLSNGAKTMEVPFGVSGYGTKVVEWYIDGILQPFVKDEDEVVDSEVERTKYIILNNLSQGKHSLQIRAYTIVNGELFYTDTLYRDIIVYTGQDTNPILAMSVTIPKERGILGENDSVAIYNMVQYVPYIIEFATYSPLNLSSLDVEILLDEESKGTVQTSNGVVNTFSIVSKTSGDKRLVLRTDNVTYTIPVIVQVTNMKLQEITNNLVLAFDAIGRSNKSADRDKWSYGEYKGTLNGFNWNNTSGWVNDRLEMNAGSSFGINLAPLANNGNGKTIEIEWSTKNVTNDDAIICDLRENNVGICIYATKVSLTSADGVTIETEYKSDENVRIAFVINRSYDTVNKGLSFIFSNGIVSRSDNWSASDNYISNKEIYFKATEEVEISLKAIRVYNTALTNDLLLNNFNLYRDTVKEMTDVYDRNDVYMEGTSTFDPEKMMGRLPVMIVTGDIPTLENTSDKDTLIVVDIEYINMQDRSLSFTMKNAAMRPQGTSSMGYPKKNFRIYTEKVYNTQLFDADGKEVVNKLYAFKKGSQPVNCWCLKADYAESSGTHNTGIARLWNEALFNAQIQYVNCLGEVTDGYALRTKAQQIALESGYPYDVRTTIDGFPILLFYRPSANDNLIFIGKYNFNNDKSTESVFGFKGIPNFDNSKMQCWEILNNGNALALFQTINGFDANWSEAYESRYPDTKTPYTGDLKAFSQWMTTVKQSAFRTEKWAHLDVYKMAAYWCYLMRHAGADQFVKNAMFTSEDGVHFYFILYDNDTINGLINTGRLKIKPTDDRQTIDEAGAYVFAGHDSRLWNMLEADEEFMQIVSVVDNALYSAGISYLNTIKMFDEEQADKWVERVYNQDAQYKYISPYVEKGVDNLFMLQGKRDLHRKWWLSKRFAIYDAKYVSGTYKSQAVEIKCINGTQAGQQFTITSGYPLSYGYGINNLPRKFGIDLQIGESYTFTTEEVVNLGDPVRIYGAPNIAELDFSKMSDRLAVVTIANVYDEAQGTKLKKLVVGGKENNEVTEISGLDVATSLEYIDVAGMKKMVALNLGNHPYIKTVKAQRSGIASVTFAKGAPVTTFEIPSAMRVLTLEQLPYLTTSGLFFEDLTSLTGFSIKSCPQLCNDYSLIKYWMENKTTEDGRCTMVMDNVEWSNVDVVDFMRLCNIKKDGGTLDLKGRISIPNATIDAIYSIRDLFGETVFYPNAELYIEVPTIIEIKSKEDYVLEGDSIQFEHEIYPVHEGTFTYSIVNGRLGCSINPESGLLSTSEIGEDTSTIIVRVTFVSNDGKINIYADKSVEVVRRTYPSGITIHGNGNLLENLYFTWSYTNEGVNGEYSVEWLVSGDIASYYTIDSVGGEWCLLIKVSSVPETKEGTLKINVRRNFDNAIVATDFIELSHVIVWPKDATIIGSTNPLEKPYVYTWETTTEDVNGDYYAEWSLSGDVTSVIAIASQDDDKCVMELLEAPTEIVTGFLTLTLYKTANDSVILTVTKELEAIMEGVVITSKTNRTIQNILYSNGLVANETYSLKEELEKITSSQLQRGADESTSIFAGTIIGNFEEFQYFTGLDYIPDYLFSDCDYLDKIILPDSIKYIGNYAFIYCRTLKDILLPEGITSIGERAFSYSGLQHIIIPDTVTNIFGWAFYSCYSLKHVSLSQNLLSISKYAFNNCGLLETVIIPNKVTTIGEGAFALCSSLTEITIGSDVKTIGEGAFAYCKSLKRINCLPILAPITTYTPFGTGTPVYVASYTGRESYATGENMLHIPSVASGYEEGDWAETLLNPEKCGFSIYGKIVIVANKPSYYNITYVTIDNIQKTIRVANGAHYLNDILYNTEMTITVTEGGTPNEGVSKTFIYNAESQNHTYTFPSDGSWIVIDQNITDPMTMISGDVNGEHIQKILNNTHRYLGKYTASGKMTLCQLSDTDSAKYADGTTASTTGSEGDVFVKLPRFWYACYEESPDVWKIGFFTGDEAPTEPYWNEWDGNDLLGAYDGYIVSSKMYSQSGRNISSKTSLSSANSAASRRGSGFSTLPMKWYNMLYLLYYAKYGTTNFASKYSSSIGTSYTTGVSNSVGMTDSPTGNNFCGIEGLVRSSLYNYIGNVLLDFVSTTTPITHKWKITESDGSVREVIGTIEGGYVQKMVFGANADIIPAMGNGTSSQGFCVNFTRTASSNRAVYVSLGSQIYANVPNNNSASVGRLAFRGIIVEESNSTIFKSLTAIG